MRSNHLFSTRTYELRRWIQETYKDRYSYWTSKSSDSYYYKIRLDKDRGFIIRISTHLSPRENIDYSIVVSQDAVHDKTLYMVFLKENFRLPIVYPGLKFLKFDIKKSVLFNKNTSVEVKEKSENELEKYGNVFDEPNKEKPVKTEPVRITEVQTHSSTPVSETVNEIIETGLTKKQRNTLSLINRNDSILKNPDAPEFHTTINKKTLLCRLENIKDNWKKRTQKTNWQPFSNIIPYYFNMSKSNKRIVYALFMTPLSYDELVNFIRSYVKNNRSKYDFMHDSYLLINKLSNFNINLL